MNREYQDYCNTNYDPEDIPGPERWIDCPACEGSGVIAYRVTVYEHGCGVPHDDSDERPCGYCGGFGGVIDDMESD